MLPLKLKSLLPSGLCAIALSAVVLSTSGCGKEEFVKQNFSGSVTPVGYRVAPAKLDVLLVTDNSPSANGPYVAMQNQLSSFVSTLSSKGWDYHIAAIPIASSSTPSISRVLVDRERNSPTLNDGTPNPSYDRSAANGGLVPNHAAVYNANEIQVLQSIATGGGSSDPALSYITSALSSDSVNFTRPDSLSTIVIVTNGQDSSGTGDWAARIQQSLRNKDRRLIKVFSVVSDRYVDAGGPYGTNCWGGGAYPGTSYIDLAQALSGQFYNFCQTDMAQIIPSIAQQLNITKTAYVTGYLVFSQDIIVRSIKKSTGEVIPANDSVNGWTYLGYQTVHTIVSPIQLNRQTGYVIALHGQGQLRGDESADVDFQRK